MSRSHHLLVPMDDSEPARAALEYALERFPQDDITILHAVDDLAAGYAGRPPAVAGTDTEPDFFDEIEETTGDHGGTVETQIVGGTAGDAILEYVKANDIDGIVMGSQGRSGVSRMLLGSIAEKVTRRASVPVTIVP